MEIAKSKAISIASSHLITTLATLAALLLFVALGSQIVPSALHGAPLPASKDILPAAFLLNIAIILFGWWRSRDLKTALEAYDAAERAAYRNANTDQMTGLSNRNELMRALDETLQKRSPGVLVMIDLDHFKRVNDLHGHHLGDLLLKAVAETLSRIVPDTSCRARIGGDEFALLLNGVSDSEAEAISRSLLDHLSRPFALDGIQAHIAASIGLTSLGKSRNHETVLRQSDVALYAAKRSGRNCLAWFDEALERELTDRLKLEEDIRRGIQNGEFVPFFQPLIDLTSRELVGFEALARWRSDRGLLEPETFLEAAETTGLIGQLTMSVMEQALREARDWPSDLKIAVNVSPVQFRDAALADHVLKVLTATGFPANRLEIEITEASLLEDREQFSTIIESLKNLGIRISLDDFGTGYASLARLDSLPIDRIKIDKTFVNNVVKSKQTAAIVNTITNLGHTLAVPITAEGVESENISFELKKLGCSEAQGWLYGRAVSGDTVRSYLKMAGKDSSEAPPATGDEVGNWVLPTRRSAR